MPNIKVKYIIDENGDRVAPVTHIDAVRDSSGNGLSEILEDKPDATDLSAVATSGDYTDLENTPTSEAAVQDGNDLSLVTTGEKYIWNNKANNTAMVGATASVAGSAGLVPAPAVADKDKFLKGNGKWESVSTISPNNDTYEKITGSIRSTVFYTKKTGGSSTWYLYGSYFVIPMTEAEAKKIEYIKVTFNRNINRYTGSNNTYTSVGTYNTIIKSNATNIISNTVDVLYNNISYNTTTERFDFQANSIDYSIPNGSATACPEKTGNYVVPAGLYYMQMASGYNGTPNINYIIPNNTIVNYEIIKRV